MRVLHEKGLCCAVSRWSALLLPFIFAASYALSRHVGSLPTTKGPKYVHLVSGSTPMPTSSSPRLKAAAEVEELREKIAQLESALATMQSAISDEPHPLLKDASSASPSSSSDSSGPAPPPSSSASGSQSSSSPPALSQEEEDDVIDSFGTTVSPAWS